MSQPQKDRRPTMVIEDDDVIMVQNEWNIHNAETQVLCCDDVILPPDTTVSEEEWKAGQNRDGDELVQLAPPPLKRKKKMYVPLDDDSDDDDLFDEPTEANRAVKVEEMRLLDDEEEDDEDLFDQPTRIEDVGQPDTTGLLENTGVKRKEPTGRITRYCITYNNPTVGGEEFDAFLKSKTEIKGFVFQEEVGRNGVKHFQGYIEINNKKTTTGMHTLLRPHKMSLLFANGTKAKNLEYCTKEDTRVAGPWLYGTLLEKKNGQQGKRTDLDDFAEAYMEGGLTEELVEKYPGLATHPR